MRFLNQYKKSITEAVAEGDSEKEREYIDIYQTKAFGMNTTKGNK